MALKSIICFSIELVIHYLLCFPWILEIESILLPEPYILFYLSFSLFNTLCDPFSLLLQLLDLTINLTYSIIYPSDLPFLFLPSTFLFHLHILTATLYQLNVICLDLMLDFILYTLLFLDSYLHLMNLPLQVLNRPLFLYLSD